MRAPRRVGHRVQPPRSVLDGEVEPEQLADPLVLRNGGEALVQEVLQAIVISPHEELAPPQVRTPVSHRLNQPNELPLVCCQLQMPGGKRSAEERDGSGSLVEHGAKPNPGRVAVDDEQLVEVRHLEDGSSRQGAFKCLERVLRVLVPCEGAAEEKAGEGSYDEAKVADELPIVPGQPQEPAKAAGGARWRPGRYFRHLVCIHGDALGGDDVAQIGYLSVWNMVPTLTSSKRRGLSLNGRC
jgi:hypothetical protein